MSAGPPLPEAPRPDSDGTAPGVPTPPSPSPGFFVEPGGSGRRRLIAVVAFAVILAGIGGVAMLVSRLLPSERERVSPRFSTTRTVPEANDVPATRAPRGELQLVLAEGRVYKFNVTTTCDGTIDDGGGSREFHAIATEVLTLEVERVDDDGTVLGHVWSEPTSLEVGGVEQRLPEPYDTWLRMHARGSFTSGAGFGFPSPISKGSDGIDIGQFLPLLPEPDVGVGETWSTTFTEVGVGSSVDVRSEGEVLGVEEWNGHRVLVVDATAISPYAEERFDLQDADPSAPDGSVYFIGGNMRAAQHVRLDAATHELVQMEMTDRAVFRVRVEGASGYSDMEFGGTLGLTIEVIENV